MRHKAKVFFGKETIMKIEQGKELSELEKEINYKEFEFNTVEEKSAFCNGLSEAVGWMEIYINE